MGYDPGWEGGGFHDMWRKNPGLHLHRLGWGGQRGWYRPGGLGRGGPIGEARRGGGGPGQRRPYVRRPSGRGQSGEGGPRGTGGVRRAMRGSGGRGVFVRGGIRGVRRGVTGEGRSGGVIRKEVAGSGGGGEKAGDEGGNGRGDSSGASRRGEEVQGGESEKRDGGGGSSLRSGATEEKKDQACRQGGQQESVRTGGNEPRGGRGTGGESMGGSSGDVNQSGKGGGSRGLKSGVPKKKLAQKSSEPVKRNGTLYVGYNVRSIQEGSPRHEDKVAPKTSREVVSGAERSQGNTNLGGAEGPGVLSKGEDTVSRRPNPLQNSSEGRGGPIKPSGGNCGKGDVQPAGPLKENEQGGTRGGAGALQRCILCQAKSRDLKEHVLDSHLPRGFYEAHPSEVVAAMMLLADALGTDFYSLPQRCKQMILPRKDVWRPSTQEREFFLKLGKHVGVPVKEPLTLTPPNHVVLCTQWSVVLKLLISASKEAREVFRAMALSSATQGAATPPGRMGAPVTSEPKATTAPPRATYAMAVAGRQVTPSLASTSGAGIEPTHAQSPASTSGGGIKPTPEPTHQQKELPPALWERMKAAKSGLKHQKITLEALTFTKAERKMLPASTRRTFAKAYTRLKREAQDAGLGQTSTSAAKVPRMAVATNEPSEAPPGTSTASDPGEVVDPRAPAEEEMEVGNSEGEGTPIQMIDAHFHLDRTFGKIRERGRIYEKGEPVFNLPSLLQESRCSTPEGVQLLGAVASFCDPDTLEKMDRDKRLRDHLVQQSNLGLCFGLHPKHAEMILKYGEGDRWVGAVTTLSKLDNVVALGEIGLDLHLVDGRPRQDLRHQKQLLEMILSNSKEIIERGLPVVIHCREAGGRRVGAKFEDSACQQTINILRKYLPQDHRVYVHFFNGGSKEIGAWIAAFPKVVFGLIGGEHGRIVINEWSLKELFLEQRVVAETDAPYMRTTRAKLKTPMDIHHLLQEVQKRLPPVRNPRQPETPVHKLSLEEVAQNILENTRQLFQLKF